MKFTNKVKHTGGGIAGLLKKLKTIDGAEASAGYDDTPHSSANMSLATLAYLHEMGAPKANIVARPFMTEAAYHNQDNITLDYTAKQVQQYLYGKGVNFRTVLHRIADMAKDNIPYAMDTGNYVITKNPTPLMDTWELRESAKSFVKTGNET